MMDTRVKPAYDDRIYRNVRAHSKASTSSRPLLPVADQHVTARGRELRPIVLEASQNRKIALIHQRAAKTLDVARASLLILLRAAMSQGASRDRGAQQDQRQEALVRKYVHCVCSFRLQTILETLDRQNAVHSITIAWSLSPDAGALRSSRTRGMAASESMIINL